jgi:predicted RNase H-like nuclease (RuvC/YqgF family)
MSNLAKQRITDLEAEIKTLTEANVAYEDQIRALTTERDQAVQKVADIEASKNQEIEDLKAKVASLSEQKESAETNLDEKIKSAVAQALTEAGHEPVSSGANSGSGDEPKAKSPTEMTRFEAAKSLASKLGLSRAR